MNPRELLNVARALAAGRRAYRGDRNGWACSTLIAPAIVPGLEIELVTVIARRDGRVSVAGHGWISHYRVEPDGATTAYSSTGLPAWWGDPHDDPEQSLGELLRRAILDGFMRSGAPREQGVAS